jgi:predicted transcriptional regulator
MELEVQQIKNTQNNLLENVRLRSIHSTPYSFVDASESLIQVYAKILETDYSQFVVKMDDKIVGSISERAVNRAIIEKGVDAHEKLVSGYVEDAFPVLSVNTLVASVVPLLQSCQAVLTRKDSEIVGIVTNNDIGKIFKKI